MVLQEPERLVVGRVDDDPVRGQAGHVLHGHDRPEDGVLHRLARPPGQRLDAGAVEHTVQVRAGAVTVQDLALLGLREHPETPVVDLGDHEGEILDHLIRDIEPSGNLGQLVRPGDRVRNVDLGLLSTLGHGREGTLGGGLHEVRHHGPGDRAGTEEVRHEGTPVRANHGAVHVPEDEIEHRTNLVNVGVRLGRELRGPQRGVGPLLQLEKLTADLLGEVVTEVLGPGASAGTGCLILRLAAAAVVPLDLGQRLVQVLAVRDGLDLHGRLVGLGQETLELRGLIGSQRPTGTLRPLRDLASGLQGLGANLLPVHT